MIKGLILQSWVFAVSIGFCGNDRCWASFHIRCNICILQLRDCTGLVKNLSACPPNCTGQVPVFKPKNFKFMIQVLQIMGQTSNSWAFSVFMWFVNLNLFFKVSFLPFRFSPQESRMEIHFCLEQNKVFLAAAHLLQPGLKKDTKRRRTYLVSDYRRWPWWG